MLSHVPPRPARTDFGIGIAGAGFIVRDVQLVAYAKAGYNVRAIASANPHRAREAASLRSVPNVYDTVEDLLNDPAVEVLDIAVPPHAQPAVIHRVLDRASHIKGILAQKPLALNYADAVAVVNACERSRRSRSRHRGHAGDSALAALDPRVRTSDTGGDEHPSPGRIPAAPRPTFPHRDGIVLNVLANGASELRRPFDKETCDRTTDSAIRYLRPARSEQNTHRTHTKATQ